MAELFDAEGVWSSPGGSAKVFLYDDIKLTWYADNNSIIFKGVKGKILERSVISMLKNGCLLTNALSNDNGKLNVLDHGNCDENKDESFLRDCSSQTASQCERCINCDRLLTEVTDAVTKIDGLYETVNKIFELVCKINPTLPTSKIMQDLSLNDDLSFAKDINSDLRTVCELSTDLEGVKLDAVITETKLCKNIYTNHENINKNMKSIEKISQELAIVQREQEKFRKICKQDLVTNQLIHQSDPIQSEQGKGNQQISEQCTSTDQIREGLAVTHDEHVLSYSSKHSSEIMQSKEKRSMDVNVTSSHTTIVHDRTPLAVETMPNQDKQHEHNVHCPVGNRNRPLIQIIDLCEDVACVAPNKGLNQAQENYTLPYTPTKDQRKVTSNTTHCNDTIESDCEIDITNLTNSKPFVPETNLTMQNISPRITTTKTLPKVPIASSHPMLKNTKKNFFPLDWLEKLPLIERKYKPPLVKSLNNDASGEIDDHFLERNWKKRSRLTRNLCPKQDWLNHLTLVRSMMK